jgi:hypothetical protein
MLADDRGVRAALLAQHVERDADFHDVLPLFAAARFRLSEGVVNRELPLSLCFPAKAGIHPSAFRAVDKWLPASAGKR